MKKTLTVFAILSVVLLFAADGFTQPAQRMGRGKACMERSPSRILFVLKAHKEELQITDEQLKQVEDMVFSFEEQHIVMRSQASSNRLAMQKLMSDREKVNYDQVKAVFVKAAEHRADMVISRFKIRDEVNKVLTSEQQDALKSLRKERFKTRRDFRGIRECERRPRFRNEFRER